MADIVAPEEEDPSRLAFWDPGRQVDSGCGPDKVDNFVWVIDCSKHDDYSGDVVVYTTLDTNTLYLS